eukprot:TRINITY_DN65915_c6_g2_i1.p1 TRINITY_DN65915_c6_g2~~TRINITY_DN65915_c6_g2_i1.p1  ORF type:complete len:748 (+),score=462.52 TRINITY_DN65915_c6_g2_i1:94-2244(+)
MKRSSGKKKSGPRAMSRNTKIINPHRQVDSKKQPHLRDNATIRRLAMYKQKPIRSRDGKMLSAPYASTTPDEPVRRIAPNRKWFGNVHTIGQQDLTKLRKELKEKTNDPYTVILKQSKVPLALLSSQYENAQMQLLNTQSFSDTFGKKAQRKRPELSSTLGSVHQLMSHVASKDAEYNPAEDTNLTSHAKRGARVKEKIFDKGQSRRIWQELYKVIDSSDVLIQVLDVRDPMGTRSKRIEDELKRKERCHKHLIFVLNKCDLVPTWVTRKWVQILSAEYPTLAFHASMTNPFGKGSLIQLLRQFAQLHGDKKQISVGFIGYPNVGKSSIINTLRGSNVCTAAPIPGQTKVWQYITLFRRIFLIDCPGVVVPSGDTDLELVLKGVVRIEMIEDPAQYIPGVLERVRREYIRNVYNISTWKDPLDFLTQYARKIGKLLKGGEPDFNNAARKVLNDWQRGRLPYYVKPPFFDDDNNGSQSSSNTSSSSAAAAEEEEGASTNNNNKKNNKGRIPSKRTNQVPTGPRVEQMFEKIRVASSLLRQEDGDVDGKHNSGDMSESDAELVSSTPTKQDRKNAGPIDWDEVHRRVTAKPADEEEVKRQQTKSKKKRVNKKRKRADDDDGEGDDSDDDDEDLSVKGAKVTVNNDSGANDDDDDDDDDAGFDSGDEGDEFATNITSMRSKAEEKKLKLKRKRRKRWRKKQRKLNKTMIPEPRKPRVCV